MAGNRAHAMNTRKKKEPFTFSKLTPKQKKLWKWGAIIAACLLVVIVVLGQYDLLPHFKGNLHLVGGKLLGVDANDVIVNLGDSKNTEYYKIGKFDVPEGFELLGEDTVNVRSDELETEWVIKPSEGYQGVQYIAVCGTSESSEKRKEAVRSLGAVVDSETEETTYPDLTEGVSPVKNVAFSGYIYGDEQKDTYSGMYNRYFSTFIPGEEKDSSIMVMITCKAKKQENLPDEATLVELMGRVVDGITTK